MKKELIIIFILTSILSACTKEQYADEKMDEIAGDWVMQYAIWSGHSEEFVGPDIYPLICDASIFKQGGNWYFEFTLPYITPDEEISYHKFMQEISWNPAAGRYLFQHLDETALDQIHSTLLDTTFYMDNDPRRIVFRDFKTNVTVYWRKK